ncbi:hypothetical protein CLV93_10387 [Prolixibacter denitrificans]|uniref:Uncharacterized protein n=1 Tax=Prolixibacter denitrificans TaxID=1541063 RepID=A0A2P8CFH2_9BACT|nr:hypothetical protein CLV93_10387 [Prolixibacter denitrificans]
MHQAQPENHPGADELIILQKQEVKKDKSEFQDLGFAITIFEKPFALFAKTFADFARSLFFTTKNTRIFHEGHKDSLHRSRTTVTTETP